MEEKYPIKFSLGQFILLLGVEVVVLALVFLLGARFGTSIFPAAPMDPAVAARGLQGLAPEAMVQVQPVKLVQGKLTDAPEEPATPPDQEGEGNTADREGLEDDEKLPDEPAVPQRNWASNPIDKNTLIRFKSSGTTQYAIEVGKYFDELLASRQVSKLKSKGYEAYLVIEKEQGGASVYGVRVGSFADRKVAEDYATRMSNDQGVELRVVLVN